MRRFWDPATWRYAGPLAPTVSVSFACRSAERGLGSLSREEERHV